MAMFQISLIVICILLICLLSPSIVFLIHKKHFIWKNTEEWGYSTPKQYRYTKGTKVVLLETGDEYVIMENGRHDYLIWSEEKHNAKVVLQSEIKLK